MPVMPQVTDRARFVLGMAAEIAHRAHRPAVGPADVLVAILTEGRGIACAVVHGLGVDRDRLRASIEPIRGSEPQDAGAVDALLDRAAVEAESLRHFYVGTEHLLIALCRPESGLTAETLAAVGVTREAAAVEVARLLGQQV